MRLVARFAVAFFVLATVALFASSYFSARRAVARVDAAEIADLESLGHGLRAGFREIWSARGRDAAIQFLEAAHVGAPGDPFVVVWSPEPVAPAPPPPSPGQRLATVSVPVQPGAPGQGVLILRRGLPDAAAIVREELRAELIPAAGLAVVALLLVVTLGTLLIGGPLGRIAAQARRIGAGDLSQRLKGDSKGELGDLKRTLNAMCDQLVEARDRLEREETLRLETLQQLRHLDRLGTVGTIASGVAHELGTPLNVVMLCAHSLDSSPSPEARDAAVTIGRQVDKMSAIVRQLLGFARRDAPVRARVDLGEVAQEVDNLLRSIARKGRVQIVLQVEENRVEAMADRGQLVQVVTNLVVNAVHAMPEGGVVILRVREGLQVGADGAPARAACLAVLDQGVGISPEVLERVFEPFFTTKPRGKGTGLGLAVAKGIVEEHGGTLSVTSLEGQGSTFEVCLPAASSAEPPS